MKIIFSEDSFSFKFPNEVSFCSYPSLFQNSFFDEEIYRFAELVGVTDFLINGVCIEEPVNWPSPSYNRYKSIASTDKSPLQSRYLFRACRFHIYADSSCSRYVGFQLLSEVPV